MKSTPIACSSHILSSVVLLWACFLSAAEKPYRSPFDAAFAPDGQTLAVSDRTAKRVILIDTRTWKIANEIPLAGEGTGVTWSPDNSRLFAAERDANTVAEIDAATGHVVRHVSAGIRPVGIAFIPERNLLLACNSVVPKVSAIDLNTGRTIASIPATRDPYFLAVAPGNKLAVVGNLLPAGAADQPGHAAEISLLDLEKLSCAAAVRLPAGSTSVRKIALSPDGRWAYAVHTVGRTNVPITQLDRGWVNTNALSIIDLNARALSATLLLDRIYEGSADPWGAALEPDGKTLWISLAGTREIARVDVGALHKLLAGEITDKHPGIWQEIRKDPSRRAQLVNDLAALYAAGLLEKIPVAGDGPRGIALSPDGNMLAVCLYFSGKIQVLDTASRSTIAEVSLPDNPAADTIRRGEMLFHDATTTFQHWLSCATCHPADQRMDALNWDNLNDGIGNPKNTKSLVYSHLTPPTTWQAVRENMEISVEAGFRHIKFREPAAGELDAVRAYLRSLKPEKSPHLAPNGELTETAKRGKKVFATQGCTDCHSGTLFTDMELYDVGTRRSFDNTAKFDVPSLIEAWRTAPYLHDGSAATLKEIFTKFNPKNKHGQTSDLSQEDLDALVEYINSL
ncbi:MAG TPA: c-type cytochrome [Planctomycetota bacterium]|nr:c-type cytochrome [Planctomycetota bacterium]